MDNATTVQKSTNYNKFKFLTNNRSQTRGHIEALKKAFEESGNLTAVQPILVNERWEIIDGQHRFVAAKELGHPIFYTMQPGLRISDARSMNILHRSWTTDDFAQSYAESGDPNYIKYLELKEDYGFSHSIIIAFIAGGEQKGAFSGFRQGEFVIGDEAAARERLDKFTAIGAHTRVSKDKYFAYAFLKVLEIPGFDFERMLRKMTSVGETIVRRFGSVPEYQRALEEVYNYGNRESGRLRLF